VTTENATLDEQEAKLSTVLPVPRLNYIPFEGHVKW